MTKSDRKRIDALETYSATDIQTATKWVSWKVKKTNEYELGLEKIGSDPMF